MGILAQRTRSRNDSRRDGLPLLKEEPSKEVLFKLRTLSNQWKTIGPVAPSRITELREQFRELFEK